MPALVMDSGDALSAYLRGAGLCHHAPAFKARGLNHMNVIALQMQDYTAVGVRTTEERRRLFELIQNIKRDSTLPSQRLRELCKSGPLAAPDGDPALPCHADNVIGAGGAPKAKPPVCRAARTAPHAAPTQPRKAAAPESQPAPAWVNTNTLKRLSGGSRLSAGRPSTQSPARAKPRAMSPPAAAAPAPRAPFSRSATNGRARASRETGKAPCVSASAGAADRAVARQRSGTKKRREKAAEEKERVGNDGTEVAPVSSSFPAPPTLAALLNSAKERKGSYAAAPRAAAARPQRSTSLSAPMPQRAAAVRSRTEAAARPALARTRIRPAPFTSTDPAPRAEHKAEPAVAPVPVSAPVARGVPKAARVAAAAVEPPPAPHRPSAASDTATPCSPSSVDIDETSPQVLHFAPPEPVKAFAFVDPIRRSHSQRASVSPRPPPAAAPVPRAAQDDTEVGLTLHPDTRLDRRHGFKRIAVCVRKKPMRVGMRKGENADASEDSDRPKKKATDVVEVEDEASLSVCEPKSRVDLSTYTQRHPFVFDEVLSDTSDNREVYRRTVAPLIPPIFQGGRSTCFAYGQTGSGKTHTMIGAKESGEKGLYLLAAEEVFHSLLPGQHVTVNAYEIYGTKLHDLLGKGRRVEAREDAHGAVQICGLSEHRCDNAEKLMKAVEKGQSRRALGSTGANEQSSRSHAVVAINVRCDKGKDQFVGGITFIDLAGSERGSDTRDNDRTTRREGASINRSLLALKECIRALDAEHRHVPFRGSKLTEVLRDSFTGALCRTVMIACISPLSSNCEHTLNTLRYAYRVKELKKKAGEAKGPAMSKSMSHLPAAPPPDAPPPPAVQRSSSASGGKPPVKKARSGASASAPAPTRERQIQEVMELMGRQMLELSARTANAPKGGSVEQYLEEVDGVIRQVSGKMSGLRNTLTSYRNELGTHAAFQQRRRR